MLSRKSAPNADGAEISAQDEVAAGYAALEEGNPTAALARFRSALRAEPDNAAIAGILAETLASEGRNSEGITVAEATLVLRPDSRPLRRILARLQSRIGRQDDSEGHWRELLLLDPSDDEAMVGLASLLIGQGAIPDGIDLLQRALRVRPENPAVLFSLGTAWAELGEATKAEQAFGRYLDLDPADGLGARTELGKLDPQRLTSAYVRTLFDQYADRFEAELIGSLNYRAPELLREAVATALGVEKPVPRILDLGCGTGLAGKAFRDLARELDGVDLSPRMIDKARECGIYDALFVGDAVEFLGKVVEPYDLILAADVMVYLGDLTALLTVAVHALREEGGLAFTVEQAEGEQYRLGPKKRFAHSEDYVRRVAAEAGLNLVHLRAGPLRTEARTDVPGLVFVFTKPGAPAR